ncbi:MAG: 4-hydroxythreonine-4-phosphate dehydrogenase PdxA [Spirochaetes bacterium]|nr:4-hydroxythreonine-4-phosphate dehydrogenase PdxA [Spirochaetota bacterium]
MQNQTIKIGISLGDPAGIGPEVTLKAVNALTGTNFVPVIVARTEILEKYYPDDIKDYKIISEEITDFCHFDKTRKYIFNIDTEYQIPVPGIGNTDTGAESLIYIDKVVELWKKGIVDAIVTGPVNKSLIEKSGRQFSGHTEYIAGLINEKNPYMLMYSDKYRVLLVTTHIPVADIPAAVTAEKIYNTIITAWEFAKLKDSGSLKIAIAGLDPHCGDEGAIGTFDMNVTTKSVIKAKENSINIEGPFSADTLFTPGKWSSYNLAIAHYHDQGLIPFKVLAFDSGVNVTLGLSIVRTSPDHGTAFDIAGKNSADYQSMTSAIKLAYELISKRRN